MSVFLSIISWITFIFWQIYNPKKEDTDWYTKSRNKIRFGPPSWLFGPAWIGLYSLLTATAVTFFDENEKDTHIAIFVLFVFNIILNKTWSLVFFGQRRIGLSIAIDILMIATEIGIVVLFVIENAWVQFGLYCPYLLWTIFALYLNIRMYQIHRPIQEVNTLYRKSGAYRLG
ncbi:tryptophan-rich sensory protein [Flavobacteriaceae bacterium]|nr:tryptophan-rich sensory protein [Flavobacteriaceae bacterium]